VISDSRFHVHFHIDDEETDSPSGSNEAATRREQDEG
jgi:hypothetical protein